MRAAAVVFALGLIACGSAPPANAPRANPTEPSTMSTPPTSTDAIANELVALFNAHDGKGVVALFDDARERSLPVEKTGTFIDGVVAAKGPLASVAREGKPHDGWTPYRLKAERGDWKLELATTDGRITGLLVVDWKNDLVKVDDSGRTHEGDGRTNADYFAYTFSRGDRIVQPE